MGRYLVAGVASFGVDFGILAILQLVVGWPTWLSAGVAFLTSFAFTYSVQRLFAFSSERSVSTSLVRYAILVAVNTLATMAIVSLIGETGWGWASGKVVSTGVLTVTNYFAYRHWVFARVRPEDPAAPSTERKS